MDFNRRLNKIEDKIEVSGKKIIRISTIKDLLEYAHKKLSDDVEVNYSEKIQELLNQTIELK